MAHTIIISRLTDMFLGKTRSNLELYATVKPDVTDISNWVTVKKHRSILYIGPLKQKIAAFYRSLTPIPINMSKTDSKIDKHSMINTVPTITFRETYWPENPVKKKKSPEKPVDFLMKLILPYYEF